MDKGTKWPSKCVGNHQLSYNACICELNSWIRDWAEPIAKSAVASLSLLTDSNGHSGHAQTSTLTRTSTCMYLICYMFLGMVSYTSVPY